jgi:hypothetical protein
VIDQSPARRRDRRPFLTIVQLVVSLAGGFVSLALAVILLGINRIQNSEIVLNGMASGRLNLIIGVLFFLAASSIPSIVLCIRWFKGFEPREAMSEQWFRIASLLMIVWLAAIVGGQALLKSVQNSYLLSFIDLLVIALPLIWLLGFGLRNIKAGTWKRFWGLVTGTFFITLPVILIAEGILLLALVYLVSLNPELRSLFSTINSLSLDAPDLSNQILKQIQPLISSPQFIYGLLFVLGLLIPLLEEFFKPLLIWSFSRHNLTPAQGFAMGLISGAAFALIESLFALNATSGADYYSIALGRTGTGLLHTFNTGMMGWALAATWQDGHRLRLATVYLGVVLLHGAWNAIAVIMGLGSISLSISETNSAWVQIVPWLLEILAAGMLVTLFVMNRRLREREPSLQTPAT